MQRTKYTKNYREVTRRTERYMLYDPVTQCAHLVTIIPAVSQELTVSPLFKCVCISIKQQAGKSYQSERLQDEVTVGSGKLNFLQISPCIVIHIRIRAILQIFLQRGRNDHVSLPSIENTIIMNYYSYSLTGLVQSV